MPVELERELEKRAKKKGIKDKDAYVYGTLRKTGWKPKRELEKEKEKELSAKLDDLIQFKVDELAEYKKREHQGRASSLGIALPALGQTAISVGFLGGVGSFGKAKPIAHRDRALMHKLNIEASKAGGEVVESQNPLVPGVAWRKQKRGFLRNAQEAQVAKITGQLRPPEQGVAIAPEIRKGLKPGILAHEIGHLKQPGWMTKGASGAAIGTLGQWGPLGASLYSGLTSDEKRAKIGAIAGTAAATPMLIREVDASVRGSHLLGKHGVKGIRRLSPGIGLGTYAAVAAMPYATYRTKKALGGYDKKKEMSAMLDNLIEFEKGKRKPRSSIQAQVLGAEIPGVRSRRDPEERLRDRLSIAASLAKTGAGIGVGAAGATAAYQIHKHGKGLMGDIRKSFESMGRAGQAVENLDRKTDEASAFVTKVHSIVKSPEGEAHLRKLAKRGKFWGKFGKLWPFESTDKPIEFERGNQYRKTIAGTFQDMRKMNPGNPLTELLARMKINVPAPARGSEEAKVAAHRLRIMRRAKEFSAIEFDDTSILGPWSGPTGHQSKIDQYHFPAGLSPAAALALPFPALMAYLNQRNLQQQVFSKLERIIEFAAGSAVENIFGKLGKINLPALSGGGVAAAGTKPGLLTRAAGKIGQVGGTVVGATERGVSETSEELKKAGSAASGQFTAARARVNPAAAKPKAPTAPAATPVPAAQATQVAQQAGQQAGQQASDTGGSVTDWWKKQSTGKKWAIGGGVGLATGAAGAYALSPSRNTQQFDKWLDDVIEFAGGYVNTEEGVKKERGVGAHFNRAAGRYIGTGTFGLLGLGGGYLVDRSRWRSNILKTKDEKYQPWISKGPALESKLTDLITFADPRPRNSLGEFSGSEGGPNPNAMATTYKQGGAGLGGAILGGAAGGLAGEGAISGFKKLLEKAKKAKK